jgi:hypothetical protein
VPASKHAPAFLIIAACVVAPACAAETYEPTPDLALQLANPVAALISVPLQLNYDQGIGPKEDGARWSLNAQPVVPFQLNDDWNIVSRTILPLVHQNDVVPGAGSQTGIGDTAQSVFFSPKAPTSGGWIVGVGPVFLLPTGTDDLLSTDKWGAGPSIVALKQSGGWTRGVLANHIWSFAGDDDRADISNTLVQPFASLTTPSSWTYSLSSEVLYDWEGEEWAVPVNFIASKLTKVGRQLVSFGGGARYWVDSPANGADGFGLRVFVTLLFPR